MKQADRVGPPGPGPPVQTEVRHFRAFENRGLHGGVGIRRPGSQRLGLFAEWGDALRRGRPKPRTSRPAVSEETTGLSGG